MNGLRPKEPNTMNLCLQCFLYRFSSPPILGGFLTLYSPPLDDLGPPFVDRLGRHLRVCPIRHLPKPFMSYGSQGSTIQGFSPHKCSQEIWWDALYVGATTIPSVMSGLTPSLKLFLNSRTSSGNVPLLWPYRPRV